MQVTKQSQRTPEEQEKRRRYWRERQASLSGRYSQLAKDWRKIPINRLKQILKGKGRQELSFDLCLERLTQTNWSCEITGTPFVFDPPRHPQTISLDRIDSTKGYTHDNIRFVCLWLNYAMGPWGLEITKDLINDWCGK